jgi:hypothetical protein
MKSKLAILCLFFFTSHINSKLLIFTYAFNRPDFIEIQKKTFDRFLTEEYEFVVFNDAKDIDLEKAIIQTCNRLNIKCIRIPQKIHDLPYLQRWPGEDFNHPGVRPANAIQYSLNEYGFNHNDYLLIIDSDCFLVKALDVRKYMQNCHLAGVPQSRGSNIEYLWNGLVFMDCASMPNKKTINFNSGKVHDVSVDIGGHIHYYIQQNPNAKVKRIDCIHSSNFLCQECNNFQKNSCKHNRAILEISNFDPKTINFIQSGISNFEFLLEHAFLHYRGGGNWDNQSDEYHANKTTLLNDYIDSIIACTDNSIN